MSLISHRLSLHSINKSIIYATALYLSMTFTVLLINCGSCKASVQLNRQLNMLFLIFTKAITAEYTTRACCKWDWMAVVPSWTPLRCVLESGTLLGRHNGHILHLAQLAFSLTCRRYAKILVIEWWCPGPLLPEQKYQCGRKERVTTSLTLHSSEANISCIQLLLSCTTNLSEVKIVSILTLHQMRMKTALHHKTTY